MENTRPPQKSIFESWSPRLEGDMPIIGSDWRRGTQLGITVAVRPSLNRGPMGTQTALGMVTAHLYIYRARIYIGRHPPHDGETLIGQKGDASESSLLYEGPDAR